MIITTLRNTDIRTTTLGYGCGGLMRIPSKKRRQDVLAQAFDAGIRHFDVARMYGLGRAESEVGAFARGRREQLVLSTKFGIEVKRVSDIVFSAQGIARRVIAMFPALRRAVRRRSQGFYTPKDFSVVAARNSLEKSLRALRTDYIDIFLLHEPELADVKDTAVWEYLQRASEAGQIRTWGVAGYPGQIRPICDNIPLLTKVIQVPNDAVHRQLEQFRDCTDAAFITFSPYSEAYDRLVAMTASDARFVETVLNRAGVDLRQPGALAKMLLSYCQRANPSGVTLFYSGRPEGIRENVSAWEDAFKEGSVSVFTEILARARDAGGRMQGGSA